MTSYRDDVADHLQEIEPWTRILAVLNYDKHACQNNESRMIDASEMGIRKGFINLKGSYTVSVAEMVLMIWSRDRA